MKQLILFFHLVLALFFPYMPLVHAGMSNDGKHHCDSGKIEQQEEGGHHSMEECIEIVSLIQGAPVISHHIESVSNLDIPFEKYRELFILEPLRVSLDLHATDPPYPKILPFVGTVKIIS